MSEKKLYELTDEHKAQLEPWRDKWIANAMSTKQMDDTDRAETVKAVIAQYRDAKLTPPKKENILFVSSPFILRLAGGFMAATYYLKKNPEVCSKLGLNIPTISYSDILNKLNNLSAPFIDKTRENYYNIDTDAVIQIAQDLGLGKFGLSCANSSYEMWRGNNQWSGSVAYLSFFRHIAKLDLDYSKWQHYEAACIHGGPAIMHEDFCVTSDRPEVLTVNEDNQPHNETGPFCQWRDGTAIYALNGVYMPRWLFETPKSEIKPEEILTITNVEQRSGAIAWYGMENLFGLLNYDILDTREDYGYELLRIVLSVDVTGVYLKMNNPSVEGEIHVECVDENCKTVEDALRDRVPRNMVEKYGYRNAIART